MIELYIFGQRRRWQSGCTLSQNTRISGGSRISLRRGANVRFCQNFPKTAWNWKNLGPQGGRASLAPPLRSATVYVPRSVIEFFRNTQSWQCWYFCTTSNRNKLGMVTSWINVYAILHLSCYFELKFMWLITTFNLFSNLSYTKMLTLSITEKRE